MDGRDLASGEHCVPVGKLQQRQDLCECPVHAISSKSVKSKTGDSKRDPSSGALTANPETGEYSGVQEHKEPATEEIVTLRKVHHYNVRVREVEMLVEAMGQNDVDFISRVLTSGSNQNLLKLLPRQNSKASRY